MRKVRIVIDSTLAGESSNSSMQTRASGYGVVICMICPQVVGGNDRTNETKIHHGRTRAKPPAGHSRYTIRLRL